MMSLKDGEHRCRLFLTQMSEEDIARLTISELTEFIRRLLEEIEVRAMEFS